MDFVLTNKYVWQKSWEVVEKDTIYPSEVYGSYAWRKTFPNEGGQYRYFFSYDSPEINKEMTVSYKVLEEKEIKIPLNLFVNPKIYLYKSVR